MQAKSIKAKTVEELQAALQQSEADGFKPTLAIVFISNPDNAAALQAIFTNNGIVIFGASTFEKFTETGLAAEEIVVLLLDINPACCSIVLKEFTTATPYEAARQVGQAGMLAFKNPGFIITAIDIAMNGEELISGLNDTAGDKATVMGGVAGNPADFSGIVFTNRQSMSFT